MNRPLAQASKYLLVSVLAMVAIGGVSLLFEQTSGQVIASSNYVHKVPSYSATKGGAYLYSGRKDTWQSIKYSYIADKKIYESSFIGFWLPLNLNLEMEPGKSIQVYYLKPFPNIALLIRGSDWRLMLAFLALSASLYAVSHFIWNPEKYA